VIDAGVQRLSPPARSQRPGRVIFGIGPSTRPTARLAEGARDAGSSVPPAPGETTCCGSRHPSCSTISKPNVLAPSA
jgi:hypothetical protein